MLNTTVKIQETEIRGFISSSGIANYLGIPYGEIPERFRPARIVDPGTFHDGVIDAISYGAPCPQPVNGGRQRRSHLYEGSIPPSTTSAVDEFGCLSLNIYVPQDLDLLNNKLPVLVYIHGGGWVFGDGNSDYGSDADTPHSDGNILVREATSLGKPFIFVCLNYRLGYFGFLSSRELQDEAARIGEDYQPNLGLYDQRLGLQWVQKYIQYFGGDSGSVTIAGQSAGAWSALSHVVSNVELGQRGLIMSSLVFSYQTVGEAQDNFDTLVRGTGLSISAPDDEKLAALRKLTYDQMAELLKGCILLRPVWDSKWFAYQDKPTRLEQITEFPNWIKEVAIGWTKDETSLMQPLWKSRNPEQVQKIVKHSVPNNPQLAKEILEAYGMDNDSPEGVLEGLLDMTAESFYAMFPPTMGEVRSPPISLFRLEQIDPFEQSIYKGYAYHCLDTVLLCRFPAVAGPHAPADLRESANAMTKTFACFVRGEQPLDPFHETGKVFIFNGSKTGSVNWPRNERWRRFMSTDERAKRFIDAGRFVLTHNVAAFYENS
ncbi:hypothetical protein FQN54_001358 [Arachnomyces sp. PD_36]|nr:hypothetical protein FQN54_001358 [Arachnomyces sp. PD_36]